METGSQHAGSDYETKGKAKELEDDQRSNFSKGSSGKGKGKGKKKKQKTKGSTAGPVPPGAWPSVAPSKHSGVGALDVINKEGIQTGRVSIDWEAQAKSRRGLDRVRFPEGWEIPPPAVFKLFFRKVDFSKEIQPGVIRAFSGKPGDWPRFKQSFYESVHVQDATILAKCEALDALVPETVADQYFFGLGVTRRTIVPGWKGLSGSSTARMLIVTGLWLSLRNCLLPVMRMLKFWSAVSLSFGLTWTMPLPRSGPASG